MAMQRQEPEHHRSVEEEMELVQALQRHDPVAFDRAYRRYNPVMLQTALRYIEAPAAEDVVQDAWLAVLSAASSFEGRSMLKTWLCRIVTNKALNMCRERKRTRSWAPVLANPYGYRPWEGNDPGSSAALSEPEMALQASQVQGRINAAMASMSRDQANALALSNRSSMSGQQMSDTLDVSPGNLRVLLHRARNEVAAQI